jgi:hypothetical protein
MTRTIATPVGVRSLIGVLVMIVGGMEISVEDEVVGEDEDETIAMTVRGNLSTQAGQKGIVMMALGRLAQAKVVGHENFR